MWRRARFKDKDIWAAVDGSGALRIEGGRVAIRYSGSAGAKLYRAGASGVAVAAESAPEDLPDGVSADAPKTQTPRGSGFGKAGTRTKAQATAAADEAQRLLDALPEGTIVAFTDGACKGNPGPAGSGAVVELPDGRRIEASRALGRGTNNVAELTAIGLALDLLEQAGIEPTAPVALLTDSSYANGVLCKGWKAKANTELIAELRRRMRARPGLEVHWVAGHVGVAGNERADELANRGVAGETHEAIS